MDNPQLQALACLAERRQAQRAAGQRDAVRAVNVAKHLFRDCERRAEFLAFYWSSYSRLIERGDEPASAYSSALQNARRSVFRGSKFLESEYCGSIDPQSPRFSEFRSLRRPKVQACACGACLDVNRDCRNCGTRATCSLGNPGACYFDCLDPLPLRQLADRVDGSPSRELWNDCGGTLPAGTVDESTDLVRELLSLR